MLGKELDSECPALLLDSAGLYAEAATQGGSDVEVARAFTSALFQKYSGMSPTNVASRRFSLASTDGTFEVRLYLADETTRSGRNPLIVFFHGGGWSVGDAQAYEPFLMRLCDATSVDILSVDFRRAPEFAYPHAQDDCYQAVLWAYAECSEIRVDPRRIVLMGDSAGGNIAISVARRLKEQNLPAAFALYLLYPFLDATNQHEAYASRLCYGNGEYLISRDGLELASEWYSGTRNALAKDDLSPIYDEDLSPFSETVIVTAGFDPLLDEGRLFAERLKAAGVQVRHREVTGAIHGFLPFGELKVARDTAAWLAGDIRKCLRQEESKQP